MKSKPICREAHLQCFLMHDEITFNAFRVFYIYILTNKDVFPSLVFGCFFTSCPEASNGLHRWIYYAIIFMSFEPFVVSSRLYK